MTRNAKVYKDGPDTLVIGSGGTLQIDSGASVTRAKVLNVPAKLGHIGAGAGFATNGNTGAVTCPASQSAATFVIPVPGLNIGDTVTAFKVIAQIESAGNGVTLDADLRKLTNAAGDPTDASIGAITQVSVTADTAVSSSKTLAAEEVVASGESLYCLVTVTTAGSTDVQLLGLEVSITEA